MNLTQVSRILARIKKRIEKNQGYEDIIRNIPGSTLKQAVNRSAMLMKMQDGYITNGQIKELVTKVNKYNEWKRQIKRRADMRGYRAAGTVMYICSSHPNPAKDHAPYQGQIYVDRFWRTKLMGDSRYDSVERYIEQHGIVTVQEIAGPPVYLTTRPYCRHRFTPANLDSVLAGEDIKSELDTRKHNYNYYKARYKIHRELEMWGEARHDLQLINLHKKRSRGEPYFFLVLIEE